jgi:membrane protein DedA with SNARE-associated domain
MMFERIAQETVEFVRANEGWELPIVAALAFGESLAIVGLFVPATIALVGIGALVGASGIDFIPVWAAAAIGAAAGDWVSYWFGFRFKSALAGMWPLSRYPDLIPRGEGFVRRFGIGAVFLGRFFGPMRGAVTLAAGVLAMPPWQFLLANVPSAFLWAGVLLAPGTVALRWLQ